MYTTLEEIRTEYEKRAREYETKRKAWEAVTIKTRKNGSEYANITKACIDGATIGRGFDGRRRLEVGGWATGYVSDSLYIEKHADDGRTIYAMTPEEARAAIDYHIGYLAKQEQEQRAGLKWLEDNAGGIFDKIEAFRESLTAGAPDKQHMQWALGELAGDLIKFNTDRKYWR